MRTAALLSAAALSASAAAARAPWTPSPVPVFVAGAAGGVPQYRIPAAVVTPKGTVIAFAEKRYDPAGDCNFKTLVARRSSDMGATWGPEVVVAGASPDNSTSTGNPQVVFHPQSGRVVVVFGVRKLPARGCSPCDGVFVLDDGGSDGLAWGAPVNISAQLGPLAGHSIPGPGTGLVLATGARAGRILMSASYGEYALA
jgi:sialidase-1